MKVSYRNCEIEVKREKCLAGYYLIYYNVFYRNNFEITSGFSTTEDSITDLIKDFKDIVDDFYKNPQDYEYE